MAVSRRRVLAIFGAAAGLSLAGALRPARADAQLFTWEGTALGADASLTLAHTSRDAAHRIIDLAVGEVRRLEAIFSLYQADSELARLNRDGRVMRPSTDLLFLLTEAKRFGDLSNGAFDVTVQPLWNLYSAHFKRSPDATEGPSAADLKAAIALVDYRRIDLNPLFVSLDRRGMGVTLDGIAQGYITDKVADLLRERAIANVLVDLGETRALGRHPEGRPWLVALKDPMDPRRVERSIDLANMSVATSGGYGTAFDRQGRFHHLFDPRTGHSAAHHIGVSVVTPRATAADALSTALYVSTPADAERILRRHGNAMAYVTYPGGSRRTLSA
jgi:thiamine biosynthesis lipoprotein